MSTKKNDSNLPLRLIALLVVIVFAVIIFLAKRPTAEPDAPADAPAETPADAPAPSADAGGVAVALTQSPEGTWQLLRNGQPYFVKGVGGSKHLDDLAAAGGNSIRIWGTDAGTGPLLDRAHALGLTVSVGYWMGHKRHGFNYHDPAQVQKQLEDMLAAVKRHKDHPAVLLWGVGNEVEIEQEDDPVVWQAINEAAKAIKALDPDHPTMVVLADLGPDESKAKDVHTHCPDIDLIGINSYDGATTAVARFAQHDFGKPCLLTEYGPPLYTKDSLGSQAEATSTEKAALYARIYREGILAHPAICLGGYSFFWDSKLELTDTYFGQFLASGERLAQAEVFHELFGAAPPANRCPVVEPLTLTSNTRIAHPGETLEASLPASDPDGDPLTWHWELKDELHRTVGGDLAEGSPPIAGATKAGADGSATITAPGPGSYRLYVRVLDGKGNAATASTSLQVKEKVALVPAAKAPLPLTLYRDQAPAPPYAPSGYQGPAADSIRMVFDHPGNPHAGSSCIRASSDARGNWLGLSWQHPANDWGEKPGGFDLSGASKLTLWARGERGGEELTFALGNIAQTMPYFDTATVTQTHTLTKDWQQFTLDLTGRDLTRIKTPFVWSGMTGPDPLVFYLDDIVIE